MKTYISGDEAMKTHLKGQTLENGAVIIERSGDIVLCNYHGEYCTWKIDSMGFVFWGRYFDSIVPAVEDFNLRVSSN